MKARFVKPHRSSQGVVAPFELPLPNVAGQELRSTTASPVSDSPNPATATPRTDELLIQLGAAGSKAKFAEFARQLERELYDAIRAEAGVRVHLMEARSASIKTKP